MCVLITGEWLQWALVELIGLIVDILDDQMTMERQRERERNKIKYDYDSYNMQHFLITFESWSRPHLDLTRTLEWCLVRHPQVALFKVENDSDYWQVGTYCQS